jgi:hypothetical protein
MDYNDMMEMEQRMHLEWLTNMKLFERKDDQVFVGHKNKQRYAVPRWYKIRKDTNGREYILWRQRRLNLDEIGGQLDVERKHQQRME